MSENISRITSASPQVPPAQDLAPLKKLRLTQVAATIDYAQGMLMEIQTADIDKAFDLVDQIRALANQVDKAGNLAELNSALQKIKNIYSQVYNLASKDPSGARAQKLPQDKYPAVIAVVRSKLGAQGLPLAFEVRPLLGGYFLVKVASGKKSFFIKMHQNDHPDDVIWFISNAQKGSRYYRESVIHPRFELRVRDALKEDVVLSAPELKDGKTGFSIYDYKTGVRIGWISSDLFYDPRGLETALKPIAESLQSSREESGRLPGDFLIGPLEIWFSWMAANNAYDINHSALGAYKSYLKPAGIEDCPPQCLEAICQGNIPPIECLSCLDGIKDDVEKEYSEENPAQGQVKDENGGGISIPFGRYWPNRNQFSFGIAGSIFEDSKRTFQLFVGGEINGALLDPRNTDTASGTDAGLLDINALAGISRPLPVSDNFSFPLRLMVGGGLSIIYGHMTVAEGKEVSDDYYIYSSFLIDGQGLNVFLDFSVFEARFKIGEQLFGITLFSRWDYRSIFLGDEVTVNSFAPLPPFRTGDDNTFGMGFRFSWRAVDFDRIPPERRMPPTIELEAPRDSGCETCREQIGRLQKELQDKSRIERELMVINLMDLNFKKDTTILNNDSLVVLPRIAEGLRKILAENPEAKIVITGHTDTDGEADYNQKLSERRAEAIMAHLTGTLGIPVERVRSEGRGESE
ncbi:MAG: OmpA family protein, partial [Candidatus Margulisiibacteriota bacterium]